MVYELPWQANAVHIPVASIENIISAHLRAEALRHGQADSIDLVSALSRLTALFIEDFEELAFSETRLRDELCSIPSTQIQAVRGQITTHTALIIFVVREWMADSLPKPGQLDGI